ncbi:glutamate--tRNA ligase [Tropheryma whipplei]|uniref:Glutamate--tRNA ligase n=2 Tax=Tropheryma whipplei TaxID=2039 RepID=SYE_TROWT|nr:glutamate--tRNA ligase [Tropheryma whipplei]Q83GP4.1 RecName: Full=Glutamate--tRNA ligase; AltName: Full=Glutamyl-tRNA synthetase; Short=GluRS [Tropheryma whipplei str. Twist]Q83HJ1.1 RecName: Full=Glutamate--tRNA ligase; AltName: Full=Glutamyl-tRNA synthetase; Short=GluRS [Tropheryma whipplei TW08/27]AAO44306.1 glutamyl-tRNA synthetase [Tropheryma whipplei str. Twist]MCO8183038.1 glutamate--tRNA ligase [Tropheryma whipplei]MCO8190622.1 glutamate--tRNA ligase [Tropheryma whipplei]CAD67229.
MRDPRVRVRFCPSPTGAPHLGLVRTALFNWVFARKHGGGFIFRIEDTDATRNREESCSQLIDTLKWLGLDWDEGPDKGGQFGPYYQSQRGDIYQEVLDKLLAADLAYESFSTKEEIEKRNLEAGRPIQLGYDNYDRTLSEQTKAAMREAGRTPIIRLRMDDENIAFEDLVKGEVVFTDPIPDFALTRASGEPLYTLVNPVDDAFMKITHVLRGEDLLSSTPRQIALYKALITIGITDYVPFFGHLPIVMGEGNRKLSKRNPESDFYFYKARGFIREGLLNYLSLLGWSISNSRDTFSLSEMIHAFDVRDVRGNPARFDYKKCLAINAYHLRELNVEDFFLRLVPFVEEMLGIPLSFEQKNSLRAICPFVQGRVQLLTEAAEMVRFLLVDNISVDFAVTDKEIDVLRHCLALLNLLDTWESAQIASCIKQAIEQFDLQPKRIFSILRLAITGRRVSPPLFESMQILGRSASLNRVETFVTN